MSEYTDVKSLIEGIAANQFRVACGLIPSPNISIMVTVLSSKYIQTPEHDQAIQQAANNLYQQQYAPVVPIELAKNEAVASALMVDESILRIKEADKILLANGKETSSELIAQGEIVKEMYLPGEEQRVVNYAASMPEQSF